MVFRSPDESGPRNFFRFTPASVFLVFLSFRVFFTTASSSVFRGAAHEREREAADDSLRKQRSTTRHGEVPNLEAEKTIEAFPLDPTANLAGSLG